MIVKIRKNNKNIIINIIIKRIYKIMKLNVTYHNNFIGIWHIFIIFNLK